MDIDICAIPKIMGLEGETIHQSLSGWSPVYVQDNLGVMSIGFMLSNPDDAVIWRGPKKNGKFEFFNICESLNMIKHFFNLFCYFIFRVN